MHPAVSQKKQNILFLFYEPYKSGISRHIRYILQALQDEDMGLWVLCSSNDPEIPAFLADILPMNHLILVSPNRFFSLEGLITARKVIHENHIDTLHIHNFQSAIWGYVSAFFTRCEKIIFTPHVDSFGMKSNCQWGRYLLTILSPFTDFFIAVSHSQQERLIRWKVASPHKIKHISNHIDAREMADSRQPENKIREELSLSPSAVLVMQIGRLDRQKDPLSFLQTIKTVTKQYNNCHFLYVGDGPLRNKLEMQIKKDKLTEYVTCLGYRKDIYQLIKTIDIITSTSHWEGLPYSLIEASFFKKAIIATDIPGHSDLITSGKSGFLVNNEQDFADKLCKLIQSGKLRAKMGENCYRRNSKLFDIKDMKTSLTEIYTDL